MSEQHEDALVRIALKLKDEVTSIDMVIGMAKNQLTNAQQNLDQNVANLASKQAEFDAVKAALTEEQEQAYVMAILSSNSSKQTNTLQAGWVTAGSISAGGISTAKLRVSSVASETYDALRNLMWSYRVIDAVKALASKVWEKVRGAK